MHFPNEKKTKPNNEDMMLRKFKIIPVKKSNKRERYLNGAN